MKTKLALVLAALVVVLGLLVSRRGHTQFAGDIFTICCTASAGCTYHNTPDPCPNPGAGDVSLTYPNYVYPASGMSQLIDLGASKVNLGLKVVQTEPAGGFIGACRRASAPYLTYQPVLPDICYQPVGDDVTYQRTTGHAVLVSFYAPDVAYQYSKTANPIDSYGVLFTCYPHTASGDCPQASFHVSQSCCDLGAVMTSTDGKTANGWANFSIGQN